MTQRLSIIVNTETGEYDLPCDSGSIALHVRKGKEQFPDWTSMVITVVRVVNPPKAKPLKQPYHPTEFEKERREDIYALRQNGWKFKDIAQIYSISPSRVAEIYKREQRRVAQSTPTLKDQEND